MVSILLDRPVDLTLLLDGSMPPSESSMPAESGPARYTFEGVAAGDHSLRMFDSVGNSQSRTVRAGPLTVRQVSAGETASVKFGETIRLEGGALEVRFAGVEGDSRCPTDAICVRAGEAQVRVSTRVRGLAETSLVVDVPLDGEGSAQIGEYRLVLSDLEPRPSTTRNHSQEVYSVAIAIQPAQ